MTCKTSKSVFRRMCYNVSENLTMKDNSKEGCRNIIFAKDNVENIRKAIGCCKNVLICGIEGVGKITNTVMAVKDNNNVYYSGNPLDYEGKLRPGSYEKYLKYILSLKKDIRTVEDLNELLNTKDDIILIIDEIYGRNNTHLEQISRLFDMENIRVIQIVGCMKNMGSLIDKIDMIVELHLDSAFIVDKELAQAICRIFGKK